MFSPQTPWEPGELEGDQRGTGWEHPHSPLDKFCSSLFLFEEKQRPRGHMESLGCDYDYGWLRQDLQPVSRGQGRDGTFSAASSENGM